MGKHFPWTKVFETLSLPNLDIYYQVPLLLTCISLNPSMDEQACIRLSVGLNHVSIIYLINDAFLINKISSLCCYRDMGIVYMGVRIFKY